MMVLPDEGVGLLLSKMLKDALSTNEDYTLDLFKSNTTVGASSTFANFTIATFTGYAAVTLTRANWGTPVVASSIATSTYTTNPITFTVTGTSSDTIYGYIVRGATSGKILFAENISPARAMQSIGDTLNLTLPFELETLP